jgi:hypothetical protein
LISWRLPALAYATSSTLFAHLSPSSVAHAHTLSVVFSNYLTVSYTQRSFLDERHNSVPLIVDAACLSTSLTKMPPGMTHASLDSSNIIVFWYVIFLIHILIFIQILILILIIILIILVIIITLFFPLFLS